MRNHGCDVSPGTLYPIPTRMGRQGLIGRTGRTEAGSRARKNFRITGKGKKVLVVLKAQLKELTSGVSPEREGKGTA